MNIKKLVFKILLSFVVFYIFNFVYFFILLKQGYTLSQLDYYDKFFFVYGFLLATVFRFLSDYCIGEVYHDNEIEKSN